MFPLRRPFGVLLGFVVASAVMMLVEATNGHLLYPDLGNAARQMTDRAQMAALMGRAPAGALLVVAGGWLLGAMAGGWTTTRFTRADGPGPALVLGALLTLAGVVNHLMMPPPLWFGVLGLGVMLPGAWYGARCAGA